MYISLFLKGLLTGISIAAPVGPIGLLCIRRSLIHGRSAGLATGLGAAIADGIYSIIAGFGLTAVSSFLVTQKFLLRLGGGIFLSYLGIRSLYAQPHTREIPVSNKSFFVLLIETIFLTLANPLTIVAFTAAFTLLGIANSHAPKDYFAASCISLGVFLGSTLWFVSLSLIMSLFRNKCTPESFMWINRISGILLITFGAVSLVSLLAF
jgi:threonine/homoserine/homoserine lactone efflux protein